MNIEQLISKMDAWFDSLAGQPIFYEVVTVIVATALIFFVSHTFVSKLKRKLARQHRMWEAAFFSAIHLPLNLLILALGGFFLIELIHHNGTQLPLMTAISPARSLVIIVLMTLFLWRFINQVKQVVSNYQK